MAMGMLSAAAKSGAMACAGKQRSAVAAYSGVTTSACGSIDGGVQRLASRLRRAGAAAAAA